MLKNKKYLFFDLDGTLINSVGVWNEVDQAIICQIGGPKREAAEIGVERDSLLRRYRDAENPYEAYYTWLVETYKSSESPRELLQRRDALAYQKLAHEVDYKAGAPEFLKAAKAMGYRLAIATTTRRKNIHIYTHDNENLRSKAPLDEYFDVIYTREDVSAIKPDPKVYEKLLAHFGAKREECFIFEDSLSGVLTAKNAGIEAAGIFDPYSAKEKEEIQKYVTAYYPDWDAVRKALL